jgi:uncharacterized protein YqjF (DUF2071 family)
VTERVSSARFLTAEWRDLVIINYEIAPALLAPYVPFGTEIDTWNNTTFVSVVGFLFLKTKVMGVPIPFHRNFEEVNLRFYVRRLSPEGPRRGVVFIKEIVPRHAIAATARLVYNERYVAMPMRHRIAVERAEDPVTAIEYGWRFNGRWNRLQVKAIGQPEPLVARSQEEFIAEHYWGYAAQRDGGCVEFEVQHPPWRVWQTLEPSIDIDVEGVYGREFAECLGGSPASAFVAEGSPVVVRRGRRI